MHTCFYTYIYAYLHAFICTYMHAFRYIRTYTHTYVHTYIHTYVQTDRQEPETETETQRHAFCNTAYIGQVKGQCICRGVRGRRYVFLPSSSDLLVTARLCACTCTCNEYTSPGTAVVFAVLFFRLCSAEAPANHQVSKRPATAPTTKRHHPSAPTAKAQTAKQRTPLSGSSLFVAVFSLLWKRPEI